MDGEHGRSLVFGGVVDGKRVQPAGGGFVVPRVQPLIGGELLEDATGVGQQKRAGGVWEVGGIVLGQRGHRPGASGGLGAGNEAAPISGDDGLIGQIGSEGDKIGAVVGEQAFQDRDFGGVEVNAIVATGAAAAREVAAAERTLESREIDSECSN
jgi:hypothetical protein